MVEEQGVRRPTPGTMRGNVDRGEVMAEMVEVGKHTGLGEGG